MPLWYPACTVHLRLRFDEAFHVPGSPLPAPISPEDLLASGPLGLGAFAGARIAGGVGGLSLQFNLKANAPLVASQGTDGLTVVQNIIPLKASADLNGYRQAGKFSLGLAWKDLPVDPRAIRAIGVELHMGTVKAGDFAQGMVSREANGRRSTLQTRPNGVMNLDTLVLIGTADTMTGEFSPDRSSISIEGRDLRGILLDAPLPGAMASRLDLSKPINEVVAQILALHPQGQRFTVEVNEAEWPGGQVPSPCVEGDLTRVRLGVDGAQPGAQPKGDPKDLNFWDLITNYCFLVGGIPYFAGPFLRIRPARNLYDLRNRAEFDPRTTAAASVAASLGAALSFPATAALVGSALGSAASSAVGAGATPFKGGQPRKVGSEELRIRRLVYGRDLSSMKFERKFSGVTVPTIECVSIDTSSRERGRKKLVIARWPKDKKAATSKVDPSGTQTEKDVLRIPVPGIRSQERLERIAQDIYEEVGRGEQGGSAETKSLASYGGDNEDADMLRLRPGDAVEFLVDASSLQSIPPPVSELTDHARRSFEEEVRAVTARVGNLNLARVLVASARNSVVELTRFFRVNNVRLVWDAATGAQVSFDFQNYVESRNDVTPKQAPAGKPKRITVGPRPPVRFDFDEPLKVDVVQTEASRALSALEKIAL